jgi:hypothetical protein
MKKLTVFLLLLYLIFSFSFVFAQDIPTTIIKDEDMKGYKKKKFFQLSILGGFVNPLFVLNDSYYASPSIGLDFAYRVNKETALFFEGNYVMLENKDSLGPTRAYMNFAIGSRFYFRAKGVRSCFFIEAATGPYLYTQGSATFDTVSFQSKTIGKLGLNFGMGGEMVLTNHLFIMIKAKYNYIIEKHVTKSYVSGLMGITFRF